MCVSTSCLSVPFFGLIDEFYICETTNDIYVNCNSFFLNLKYVAVVQLKDLPILAVLTDEKDSRWLVGPKFHFQCISTTK